MSRLIDADKLKEAISSSLNTGRETFSSEIIYEAVDEQPTAFDVDKVSERLEEYLFEKYCSSTSPHDCIRCAFYEHCPECFMGCPGDQGEIIRKLQSNE